MVLRLTLKSYNMIHLCYYSFVTSMLWVRIKWAMMMSHHGQQSWWAHMLCFYHANRYNRHWKALVPQQIYNWKALVPQQIYNNLFRQKILFTFANYFYTGPPSIITVSPSISTITDRNVSLYCRSGGEEPPRIAWLYENRTRIENSASTIIHNSIESSHLILVNVQAENEELEVLCEASNSRSVITSEIAITTVGM